MQTTLDGDSRASIFLGQLASQVACPRTSKARERPNSSWNSQGFQVPNSVAWSLETLEALTQCSSPKAVDPGNLEVPSPRVFCMGSSLVKISPLELGRKEFCREE